MWFFFILNFLLEGGFSPSSGFWNVQNVYLLSYGDGDDDDDDNADKNKDNEDHGEDDNNKSPLSQALLMFLLVGELIGPLGNGL